MSVSKVDQNELPEYLVPFTLVFYGTIAGATAVTVLAAAGHHPKCRLVRGQIYSVAYSTAADTIAIEDGGGTDAATATQSTTANTATALTLVQDQYFDRNEAICISRTVGNAGNAILVEVQFESID